MVALAGNHHRDSENTKVAQALHESGIYNSLKSSLRSLRISVISA